jgi:enoyl-CoA hydratase/carnithine racemase
MNAQTPRTWAALREIGATLPADVRVVVIRGRGRAFSAGLDRAMFTREGLPGMPGIAAVATDPDADARVAEFQAGFSWLADPAFVSVASVQGHAIGAGFQLALACDLRVLADDAQLCMAETSLGLVPDLTGTGRLVHLVGYARALEICLTGRRIGAAEADRIGLATVVVGPADLEAATADLVAALLAAPVGAARETTALLAGAGRRTVAEQHAAERAAQLRLLRAMARPADPPDT